jgi:hypothetical protein
MSNLRPGSPTRHRSRPAPDAARSMFDHTGGAWSAAPVALLHPRRPVRIRTSGCGQAGGVTLDVYTSNADPRPSGLVCVEFELSAHAG